MNNVSVPCHILQETEFENGRLNEISRNFRAQADDGAVYYFGEAVDGYDANGNIVSHDGSWLVGGATDPNDPPETVNAPAPGLLMVGNPQVGDAFKPENLCSAGVDETDTVAAINQTVVTPAGKFTNAVQVVETSCLNEPSETKWYVPGVGVVQGRTQREGFSLTATMLLPQ